jgi:hypothetical protein
MAFHLAALKPERLDGGTVEDELVTGSLPDNDGTGTADLVQVCTRHLAVPKLVVTP